VIWTQHRSIAGQQVISSPVSLITGLLAGLFSHLRIGVSSMFRIIHTTVMVLLVGLHNLNSCYLHKIPESVYFEVTNPH
jgi:hypothetical protein